MAKCQGGPIWSAFQFIFMFPSHEGVKSGRSFHLQVDIIFPSSFLGGIFMDVKFTSNFFAQSAPLSKVIQLATWSKFG